MTLVLVALGHVQAAVFVPLEQPSGKTRFSTATSLSDNGNLVLGEFVTEQPELIRPALWESDGSASALTSPQGPDFIFSIAVTDDGQTVYAEDEDGNSLIWSPDSGFSPFQTFAPADSTIINDINSDGTWIVGTVRTGPNQPFSDAYRWSANSGITPLGQLPGGQILSHANAVSEDGSVVVGYAASSGGDQAFRWTEETGIVGLGRLDDGPAKDGQGFSWATAISADGRVIGGASSYLGGALPWQAFLWREDTGMQPLEFLPGFNNASLGGLSSDGRIAVGGQSELAFDLGGRPEPVAFIWDEVNGVRNLQDLLIDDFGLAEHLAGWHLARASAISGDGLTIAGEGENPGGRQQAWMVRLDRRVDVPEPAAATLVALLVAVGLCHARPSGKGKS